MTAQEKLTNVNMLIDLQRAITSEKVSTIITLFKQVSTEISQVSNFALWFLSCHHHHLSGNDANILFQHRDISIYQPVKKYLVSR